LALTTLWATLNYGKIENNTNLKLQNKEHNFKIAFTGSHDLRRLVLNVVGIAFVDVMLANKFAQS
jgi:hypothetical protein